MAFAALTKPGSIVYLGTARARSAVLVVAGLAAVTQYHLRLVVISPTEEAGAEVLRLSRRSHHSSPPVPKVAIAVLRSCLLSIMQLELVHGG